MTDRRLALKREHLAELSSGDLSQVAGGGPLSRDVCIVWPTRGGKCEGLSLDCLTGYYPSINAPCTTG